MGENTIAIIRQKDKRSGITYAYESTSYWDREKQQSRSTRRLIGRIDEQTGNIIPTRGTNRRETQETTPALRRGPVPHVDVARWFYGATYLLDVIGEKLGLVDDLQKCFPNDYKSLLSIAYYLILESDSPLSRFSKWASLHRHPYGADIPSQRSSELFASLTEDKRYHFFRLQAARRIEKEYWAYDTTSISSYSEGLQQVKYGMNKEQDGLPQLNLALLFGQDSNLPFYYRKLSGNISDVQTVKSMLADMEFMGLRKVHLVMDRGFYSAANINSLYRDHYKFLMGAKLSLAYVKEQLDRARPSIREWTNYLEAYDVFAVCVPIKWKYTQERPYKGDAIRAEKRLYLHLYYNGEKAAEDEQRLTRRLLVWQKELQEGKRKPEHTKAYEKYFDVSETPVRGRKVSAKQAVIEEAKKNYGYFALISNEIKDPEEALTLYRNKDLVEKAFGNLKERLSARRMLVSSEHALDGKLFVQFLALIYLSYMKKKMKEQQLFGTYTIQGVLDQLDSIECFERPGRDLRIGEITTQQHQLFLKLGVAPPSSL